MRIKVKAGEKMKVINGKNISAAVIGKDGIINGVQDMLDIMASAQYHHDCSVLVVYKESLGEAFFDLKTGYAGEILQKFSNYNTKIAIIGDFSQYTNKSLHDFIYECNQGGRIFFKSNIDEALASLGISR